MAIPKHCNVNAARRRASHNAPAYKLNNSAKDFAEISERLSVLWPNCTAHAQKLICKLRVEVNYDTAVGFGDLYFIYGTDYWRSEGICHVTLNTCSCDMTKLYTKFQ